MCPSNLPSPQGPKASPRDLPRSVVKTTSRGHGGSVNASMPCPLKCLSGLHDHLYGPSREPRLVVVPVVFEAVPSSTLHNSHKAKGSSRTVVKTTGREGGREPWQCLVKGWAALAFG
uniref:Uncharacterized protein n=1 Tax=Solanum tuberosum TaxID=4113 RepID=M1E0Q5_SOLTU